MEHAPRVTAPRIAHSLWEHHRSTIERLFMVEERTLEGKDGVIDTMKRDHDFWASKSQYESRLKKWGMRKKITEKEWRAILLRVQRRANEGRQTEIVFNGMVLSEQRITRELARRSSSNMNKNDHNSECTVFNRVLSFITDVKRFRS
ncbi:hypothetical protein K505DRAFT_246622 [Melanomma pulvis-pyrius CBS 109.77]|uniref:Clr5 domain-containing protein n=1 Tax=Melanomma pulvis-pyrius CBS 109.77 TaxID=1314802 RepID=A0A6A6X8N3_9PLEO|nr:hypothetical protein K505DRAFT_246622 [Melanomma pulvis-pyrius CBS 109.77]